MRCSGMEPRRESCGSRPDSPQSDDSSSESDLSSPSFNRDIDFASRTKDVIEAEPCRDNILDMAPLGISFEKEPNTSPINTTKTILSPPIDLADSTERKSRVLTKPVRKIELKNINKLSALLCSYFLYDGDNHMLEQFTDITSKLKFNQTIKFRECVCTHIQLWFG